MAKSDSDVWRQFFAANVSDLVSKVLCMNRLEAAKAIGVDYGWLRKACSIGFVRSNSRNIEKINDFFGFDTKELWTPNLVAKIQQKQENRKEKIMTKQLSVQAQLETRKKYTKGTVRVQLPTHECDVVLVMPRGDEVTLQYRLEQPSLDVVMPVQCETTTYDNVEEDFVRSHTDREVQQVAINLPPEWVDEIDTNMVSIFPELTPEQMKTFNAALEKKQHLEYLAMMMLQELQEHSLSVMMKRERDNDLMEQFYGVTCDGEIAEDPGCCSAEYYTIPSLLQQWNETTNEMMLNLAGRG